MARNETPDRREPDREGNDREEGRRSGGPSSYQSERGEPGRDQDRWRSGSWGGEPGPQGEPDRWSAGGQGGDEQGRQGGSPPGRPGNDERAHQGNDEPRRQGQFGRGGETWRERSGDGDRPSEQGGSMSWREPEHEGRPWTGGGYAQNQGPADWSSESRGWGGYPQYGGHQGMAGYSQQHEQGQSPYGGSGQHWGQGFGGQPFGSHLSGQPGYGQQGFGSHPGGPQDQGSPYGQGPGTNRNRVENEPGRRDDDEKREGGAVQKSGQQSPKSGG